MPGDWFLSVSASSSGTTLSFLPILSFSQTAPGSPLVGATWLQHLQASDPLPYLPEEPWAYFQVAPVEERGCLSFSEVSNVSLYFKESDLVSSLSGNHWRKWIGKWKKTVRCKPTRIYPWSWRWGESLQSHRSQSEEEEISRRNKQVCNRKDQFIKLWNGRGKLTISSASTWPCVHPPLSLLFQKVLERYHLVQIDPRMISQIDRILTFLFENKAIIFLEMLAFFKNHILRFQVSSAHWPARKRQ